jgi:hypothetical protein
VRCVKKKVDLFLFEKKGLLTQCVSLRSMYAWVFKDAQRLATPIKYNHPKGAVIWVTLPKDVVV